MAQCEATNHLSDGRTLVCADDEGHIGPEHTDADGERWPDPALPMPNAH